MRSNYEYIRWYINVYIHEDGPGRQMFIYTPHKYTRVSQNYTQVIYIDGYIRSNPTHP